MNIKSEVLVSLPMKGGCVVTELDVATTPDERGVGAIVGCTVTEGKEIR